MITITLTLLFMLFMLVMTGALIGFTISLTWYTGKAIVNIVREIKNGE